MNSAYDPHDLPVLDRDRALELLARAAVGRVVYTIGALPAVQPAPFRLAPGEDGGVLLSAPADSELARAVQGAPQVTDNVERLTAQSAALGLRPAAESTFPGLGQGRSPRAWRKSVDQGRIPWCRDPRRRGRHATGARRAPRPGHPALRPAVPPAGLPRLRDDGRG
ncbi:hypothetical protein [Kitasatospora sp. NPDC056531]|uniref:hypothetical protein n=1 Tax=Kitasatospora sp. NPDC056531 TaxID=3345856 RepID=UPI0036C6C006